jgi:hypothetical protein
MWLVRMQIVLLCFELAAFARAETGGQRPALDGAQPIAQCKLQTLPEQSDNSSMQSILLYTIRPLPENPLDNYERTPLGDWRIPSEVDRNDPWLRLLLVGPKRPVLIDLAVFVDGRPFRESREAWIDELLEPSSGNNADDMIGTKSAENVSEKGSTAVDAEAAAGNEQTATDIESANEPEKEGTDEATSAAAESVETPGVATQRRQAPTMRERLTNYLDAGDGAVDRAEIRWLIAEWGSGPPVLLLGPSLSWQRARLAPVLAYLDRENDGGLSAAEIASATNSLQRADIDANDVLDASEIRRAVDRPVTTPFDTDHSPLVELDGATDWDALAATLDRVYRAERMNTNTSIGGVRELLHKPSDVTLRVDFNSKDEAAKGVSIVSVSNALGESDKVVTATKDVITLDLGSDYIEFSAAQPKAGDQTDVSGTQVAVGAVVDGNPLLRLLDRDNDQRLTTRERQALSGLLSALDRDGDGAVAASEMPTPIRIAVTLGPHVHEVLATPVGAARAIAPREPLQAAPAWFASMDKNRDGDLSRGEFLGTSEQFRQIDTNGDALVSIAEALRLNEAQ